MDYNTFTEPQWITFTEPQWIAFLEVSSTPFVDNAIKSRPDTGIPALGDLEQL